MNATWALDLAMVLFGQQKKAERVNRLLESNRIDALRFCSKVGALPLNCHTPLGVIRPPWLFASWRQLLQNSFFVCPAFKFGVNVGYRFKSGQCFDPSVIG